MFRGSEEQFYSLLELDAIDGGIGEVVEDTECHWDWDQLQNLVRKWREDCVCVCMCMCVPAYFF